MAPSVSVIDCEVKINNKVKLSIGYRCQHDPNIQAYMKAVKEKTFGAVKMVSSSAGYFDGRTDHWKQKKALADALRAI